MTTFKIIGGVLCVVGVFLLVLMALIGFISSILNNIRGKEWTVLTLEIAIFFVIAGIIIGGI